MPALGKPCIEGVIDTEMDNHEAHDVNKCTPYNNFSVSAVTVNSFTNLEPHRDAQVSSNISRLNRYVYP